MTGPLYKQLANRLRASLISQGDDAIIPAERDLAARHGVSRVTVRRALQELIDAGLIRARQGSGYERLPSLVQPLSRMTSFTEDCRGRGMTPSSRWISRSLLPLPVEQSVGLSKPLGTHAWQLTRVRLADSRPLAVEEAWVCSDRIASDWDGSSLYEALAAKGHVPVRAVQRLKPMLVEPEIADMLELPGGTPVMYVNRVAYDQNDVPLEFSEGYFRADRWHFVSEVR